MSRLRLFQLAGLFVALTASVGLPGTITVLGDRNAAVGDAPENSGFYETLLGGGDTVFFGEANGRQGTTQAFYNNLSGVTSFVDGTTITTDFLAANSVDLVILEARLASTLRQTEDEIDELRDFVLAGGNLLLILEVSLNAAGTDLYNGYLAQLGSSIRLTGEKVFGPGAFGEFTDPRLSDTEVSSSSDSFTVEYYSVLQGGVAVGEDNDGNVFLATESFHKVAPIPLPAAGWLLLAVVGGMAAFGHRKRG